MTAPLVLALFALGTAALAPRHLVGAPWVLRSPSGGILAWQAVSLAVLSSVLLIGLTLALPILPVDAQLTSLVRTTHLDVIDHYATPGGNGFAALALAGAVGLTARVLWLIAVRLRRAALDRRCQLDALRLVGTLHPSGFTVIDHSVPLVYCLPGRHDAVVVVTSAALNALSSTELESVLAHERRHLRARHDLALALSGALARTFVGVPLFQIAHEQVGILVEMQADDAAQNLASRRAMATALLTLGARPQPTVAAAGSPGSALSRVRRLTGAHGPVPTRQRAAVVFGTLAVLAAPVALAVFPALEAFARDCCHVALPADPVGR